MTSTSSIHPSSLSSGPLIHLSPMNPTLQNIVSSYLRRHVARAKKQKKETTATTNRIETKTKVQYVTILDERLSDCGGIKYHLIAKKSPEPTSSFASQPIANGCVDDNNECTMESTLTLNVSLHGWNDIAGDAMLILRKKFGSVGIILCNPVEGDIQHQDKKRAERYKVSLQEGFDFAIVINCDKISENQVDYYANALARLRTTVVGAPLQSAFKNLCSTTTTNNPTQRKMNSFKLPIQYSVTRGVSSDCHVICFAERIMIIFDVIILNEMERALAHIFLQSFAETQQRSQKKTPLCDFRRSSEPPKEICTMISKNDDVVVGKENNRVGYLSFTFFNYHVAEEDVRGKGVEMIVNFMFYLDYHIKASKSFVQRRMRSKNDDFLRILNRAAF